MELKVAELIGVPEAYVAKKASGQVTRQVMVTLYWTGVVLYENTCIIIYTCNSRNKNTIQH